MKTMRVFLMFIAVCAFSATAHADEVTDWNEIMLNALRTASSGGILAVRPAAIVQASVYDAVNGIERRYTPIHVTPDAPPGASRRAAAVQAAYASLLRLFPPQQPVLDEKRNASLAAIASDAAAENSQSIARGIEWGQKVADAIWTWRSSDGFNPQPPPFFGTNAVGVWRSTPPSFAPGSLPQLGNVHPFVLTASTQFQVPPPLSLTSTQYAAELNEIKLLGSATSPARTADQTLAARFWQSASSPHYFWNRAATSLARERHNTLSENARLLAMMNVAIVDTGISVWYAKYKYQLWRPITAIQLADTDGNPATDPDISWTPLLVTPPYPEYPSGLCSVSSAAATVLTEFFGANTSFTLDSDGMPGVTRFFPDFQAALDEVVEARIWGGVHFRKADVESRQIGATIANYIIENTFRRTNGKTRSN